jgi:hypothetical protein
MKLESLKAELLTIHRMMQCIAEADHNHHEGDTVTITGVRNLLWLYRDAVERYECKSDALNAALLTIDYAVKECEWMRESMEDIRNACMEEFPPDEIVTDVYRISREALKERV